MTELLSDEQFQKYRDDKDYRALGSYFWNGFILFRGKQRDAIRKQWKQLTKQERQLCEQI